MTATTIVIERRVLLEIRQIFPAACETLKPFFDPANGWGSGSSHHEHLALRALKEEYPQLSAQESYIVIETVKRMHSANHLNHPPV